MKVLIADDHALFRDGLSLRLEKIEPKSVIFQAANFTQALKILDDEKKIDLVILDLDMPDMNWEEGLAELRQKATEPAMSSYLLPKIPAISANRWSREFAVIFPNVPNRKF